MGGSSAPSPPNYTQAAQTQANIGQQYLQQQTQANRPTQINPMGTSQWTQDAQGNWTQNTSLSPTMQGLFNTYTGNIGQQGQAASGMLGNFTNNNQQYTGVQQGLLGQAQGLDQSGAQAAYMARMQPSLDQSTNALMASLAAQGMTPGSTAYNQAVMLNNQKLNDAQNSAILNSGQWAGQQMSNLGQQYNMANALRTQPLSDYTTLMQGTQVSGNPQFSSFTNAGAATPPALLQAAQDQYQAQLQQAQANSASGSGIGGALGTVAGGLIGTFAAPGIGTVAGAQMGGALGSGIGSIF